MQRLLIGLGSLIFLLVTAILVVPFFLPRDQIKQQVVTEIGDRFGWRMRLDGSVSLSLFPGFRLIANDIGISGKAGADGIEFARARRMDVGLAWSGLFTGNIRLTSVSLDAPDLYLEIDPTGATSWEPRREIAASTGPAASRDLQSGASSPTANSAQTPADPAGYMKNIGVDSLKITNGTLVYIDAQANTGLEITAFNLSLRAPDLAGDVELVSDFILDATPLSVAGKVSNPLGLVSGDQVPLRLAVSSGQNEMSVSGTASLEPLRADLAVDASGPSLQSLAALAGHQLAGEPGAFALAAKVSASEAAVSVGDLAVSLGDLSLGGSANADLSGAVPELSGQVVLNEGSMAGLLLLAGQDLPASGQLTASLSFQTAGASARDLLAGLDLNGRISVMDGEVGGLGLAQAVGGDEEADRITDLTLDIAFNGLEEAMAATGALTWRGAGFTVTGEVDTARLLASDAGALSATLKGNRLSLGFDGMARLSGDVDGAVRVQTADLRGLMAWMGQPLASGGGLKTFNASGLFGFRDQTISFEETRFLLDETSGEANGRIVLGARPQVTAQLALRELVLDPYLSEPGGAASTAGSPGSGQAASSSGGGTAPQEPESQPTPGWSAAPLDFSGLAAVDADLQITSQEIRWDDIKVGESTLSARIADGVLSAELDQLTLYGGSGQGAVRVDGAAAIPAIAARFALEGVDAYPLLRDTADFEWIEGTAGLNLDLTASGGSQQQLVESLTGSAGYTFTNGAIRGINIPQMVRGLSVETLLGWQANPAQKTDFSSLSASFNVANGVAVNEDLALIGPLVQMSGAGTTDMPAQRLSWRVEPRIVASLGGQSQAQTQLPGKPPVPLRKGQGGTLAGLGVPIVVEGPWSDPQIYPDIAGILENPEAAYQQLEQLGGGLLSILKGDGSGADGLAETANQLLGEVTGSTRRIDVQKVIEGDVNDEDILKAVEEGFGLPAGLLGNVLGGRTPDQ